VQLLVPSRTIFGMATTVVIGTAEPDGTVRRFELPDLASPIVSGRVDLPPAVPTERIGVLFQRVDGDPTRSMGTSRGVAGVEADGRFSIDLPAGTYGVQLADLVTGIIFHTEANDTVVGRGPLLLAPKVRWLAVECVPSQPGGEVALHSFLVTLERPRASCGAFLQSWGGAGGQDRCSVRFRACESNRWLVPAGKMAIAVQQSFGMLHPWANVWRPVEGQAAVIDIDQPEQRVTLEVPAPPTDEELSRRQ
jgi:hypothetical protein